MASSNPPIKNVAYVTQMSLQSFATPGTLQANPTLAAGDVTVIIDGVLSTLGAGSSANMITLPAAVSSGKVIVVSLAATEMNGDCISVIFSDQTATKEWADYTLTINTAAAGAAGLTAPDVWDYLTSAISTSGSIGKLLKDDINATVSSRSSQTSVDDLPTNAELATALAGLNDIGTADILAAVYEGTDTFQDFLREARAVLMGISSGHPTSPVFKGANGTTTRVSATLDVDGNRSAVVLDPS